MLANDGDDYLRLYPKLRKWIVQCVGCQRVGYRLDLPDRIGVGFAAQNLRRLFRPLSLSSRLLCEQCEDDL